mmetsp:Transcript_8017/g.18891  ORF Transcript_8017/g.18891 Transcript_8017/m.18891 type:complete len:92 (-) Transcript_8017:351-626(-)
MALLHAGSEDGNGKAALAIGELAKDAATRALLVTASVLPLLVELLHVGIAAGRWLAEVAIGQLAKDEADRAPIVAAGALPPLVEMAFWHRV